MPQRSRNNGLTWIERDMIKSKAFRKLTKLSILVYLDFLAKRKYVKVGRSGPNAYELTNNGEIVYTYREAEGRGISRSSFQRAIDQLIEYGFISVAKSGRGMAKTATLYAIDGRWEKYGQKDFTVRKRPSAARWRAKKIGFQKGHPRYPPKSKMSNSDNTGITGDDNTGDENKGKNGN